MDRLGRARPGAEAGAGLARRGWPGVEGVDLLARGRRRPAPTVRSVDADALEALRIECGVPAMGAELTADTIPAEAGQWLIDASVSFTKGCYTGQELVARIDSRGGNVPRPVRGLRLGGPMRPSAAPVVVDGKEVGALTSVGAGPSRSAPIALGAAAALARGRCRRSQVAASAPPP